MKEHITFLSLGRERSGTVSNGACLSGTKEVDVEVAAVPERDGQGEEAAVVGHTEAGGRVLVEAPAHARVHRQVARGQDGVGRVAGQGQPNLGLGATGVGGGALGRHLAGPSGVRFSCFEKRKRKFLSLIFDNLAKM